MRKTLYIYINEEGIFAHQIGRKDKKSPASPYAMLTFPSGSFGNIEAMTAAAQGDAAFSKTFPQLRRGPLPIIYVPAANTPRTVIRITPLPEASKRLTAKDKWELVTGAFPIGDLMNEKTHIFDGYILGTQFFMAALPMDIADTMAQFCASLIGGAWKIKRMEATEHLLFRYIIKKESKPDEGRQWFIFPQSGSSLRVLTLTGNQPEAVTTLPTLDEIKDGALHRLWQAETPEKVTLLTRPDWAQEWEKHEGWLCDFLTDKSVVCKNRDFTSA